MNGRRILEEPAASAELRAGLSDMRGVPLGGRQDEYDRLRAAGAADLPWARLLEGHVNALQLIGRLGTARQRERAENDVADGSLFGVWNTEPRDGVRAVSLDAHGAIIGGRKTFASGAGRVARALITVALPSGSAQLVVVEMDRVTTKIDTSFWRPYGMEDSDSFAVSFDGVRVPNEAFIGEPGDYSRDPWFAGGASRFVAVQTGAIERLVEDFGGFLRRRELDEDPIALTRFGECVVAVRSALLWTAACTEAWIRYDATPAKRIEEALLTTVDAARSAVERHALDVAERVERGVGARGLLEPEPFARRLRDLRMYLRQPAIDASLLRVARSSLRLHPIN